MKKRQTKMCCLAAAAMFGFALSACGSTDDVAGDDWRTSGVVAGSGTITHDGKSVDVLVAVSETSAAFYWDEPEQVLYDSILFPMHVPDAEQAFNAISFDDMDGDGESDVLVSFIDEYGDNTELIWIWDPVERYVFREDLSTIAIGDSDQDAEQDMHLEADADLVTTLEDYVGLWEYQGENRWLRIHDDFTWEFVNDQDDVIESGTLWVEENGITLHFDGSGDTLQLDLTVSGDLMDLTNGGSLFPVEAIQSSVPYFTRNGLEMNAEVELGTFLLANGASSYSGKGNGYRRSDCYWEITKRADDIHDGIRDLHFDAICYIPESAISSAANGTVVVSSELYDAYTGMWLTAGSTFNNSSRGDNYYLHTVSWRGNSYLIEFTYSTDWNFQVGDWGAVLTKSYSVYMPADYDGLVFAAQAEPDTYQESARKMQLDSIFPEACVLDLDTLEPYSSLYFSLCD